MMRFGFKPIYYTGEVGEEIGLTPDYNTIAINRCEILLGIERVIFNNPATIILWRDGTKTVVKVHGEPFDKEKGMAMAILRKLCGSKIRKEFKKWTSEGTKNDKQGE